MDDIIIQTDKNASDIDVENIVNRKVRRMLKKRKQILFDFFLVSHHFCYYFINVFVFAFDLGSVFSVQKTE